MNKIFVVEGKADKNKIKSVVPNATVITTGGFSFGDKLIKELIELSKTNKLILFLDPDYAGETIRKTISRQIKNVTHIYTRPELCQAGKKIGVEHLNKENLLKALSDTITFDPASKTSLTYLDIFSLGLTGNSNAKLTRDKVCKKLMIRSGNAKDFLEKLRMLGIDQKKLKEMVKDVCS